MCVCVCVRARARVCVCVCVYTRMCDYASTYMLQISVCMSVIVDTNCTCTHSMCVHVSVGACTLAVAESR